MDKMDNNGIGSETDQFGTQDDHDMMVNHVIQGDHELLYLHTYLSEFLGKEPADTGVIESD